MLSLNRRTLFAAALLLLPCAALATDISINSVCTQGTCPPPTGSSDAVGIAPAPSSTSGSGSTNITLGTDTYSISWVYSASYGAGGSSILVDPTVTYTGTSPSTSADTITFDLFQSYYDTTPGSWAGTYHETVPLFLSSGVGTGSYEEAQLCYDSDCLPLVQLLGPGSTSATHSAALDFGAADTANNLVAEYEFTYGFGIGTTSGSVATSPTVPEPAEALPLGLALLGFACYRVVVRRRSSIT